NTLAKASAYRRSGSNRQVCPCVRRSADRRWPAGARAVSAVLRLRGCASDGPAPRTACSGSVRGPRRSWTWALILCWKPARKVAERDDLHVPYFAERKQGLVCGRDAIRLGGESGLDDWVIARIGGDVRLHGRWQIDDGCQPPNHPQRTTDEGTRQALV